MGAWCTSPTNSVKEPPQSKENKNKNKKNKNKNKRKPKKLALEQIQEENVDNKKQFLDNPFKRPAAWPSNPQENDHSDKR